jgi:hypothetical protein
MVTYKPGGSHGYDKSKGFSDPFPLTQDIAGQFSDVERVDTIEDLDFLINTAAGV